MFKNEEKAVPAFLPHGQKWQIKRETEQTIIVCEQGKKNANKRGPDDALADGRDENSDTARFAPARRSAVPPIYLLAKRSSTRQRRSQAPCEAEVRAERSANCVWLCDSHDLNDNLIMMMRRTCTELHETRRALLFVAV